MLEYQLSIGMAGAITESEISKILGMVNRGTDQCGVTSNEVSFEYEKGMASGKCKFTSESCVSDILIVMQMYAVK